MRSCTGEWAERSNKAPWTWFAVGLKTGELGHGRGVGFLSPFCDAGSSGEGALVTDLSARG